MKLFKKAKKGFTLVELVVVIAVIAILAAVSVGAYFGVTDSANRSKLEQEAKQAYTNIQLVSLVDSKDGFDLDIDGLSIDKLDDFQREVAKAGGDYDLRDSNESINENKPTVIFSETAVQAENTTKTYKQFDYYIPTISGMHANCNLLNGGKITIVKGDNPVFGEESNTPVVPDEPEHVHSFNNEGQTCDDPNCNFENPNYVEPSVTLPADFEITAGASNQIIAEVQPTTDTLTWTVEGTGLTIDENGRYTSEEGKYDENRVVVTATSSKSASDSVTITIKPDLQPSVVFTQDSLTVTAGNPGNIPTPTVAPLNDTLTYSIESGEGLTIQNDGSFTTTAGLYDAKTVTVKATSSRGAYDTIDVIIEPDLRPSISIPENIVVTAGQGGTIAADVQPAGDSVTFEIVEGTGLTLGENGTFTTDQGIYESKTVTIKATTGREATATCVVTINPDLTPSVTFNPDQDSLTITAGDEGKLSASALPETDYNLIKFSSGNDDVLLIDEITGEYSTDETIDSSTTVIVTVTTRENITDTIAITIEPKVVVTSLQFGKAYKGIALENGAKVIIAHESSKTVLTNVAGSSRMTSKTNNDVVNNSINVNSDDNSIYTVEMNADNSGSFALKSQDSKYLYRGDSTDLQLANETTFNKNKSDTKYWFTLDFAENSFVAKIATKTDTGRYLKYRTESSEYYCVQSGGEDVVLFIQGQQTSGEITSFEFTVSPNQTSFEQGSKFTIDYKTGSKQPFFAENPTLVLSTTSTAVAISGNTVTCNSVSASVTVVVSAGNISYNFTFKITEKTVVAQSYKKVTSALSDWSGTYLIVYESGKVAFNGGLTTLDAVKNTISITISNSTIVSNTTTNAAAFTIAKSGNAYTIKSKSGYFIGKTASGNGLNSNTSTQYTNSISYSNGTLTIKSSGGPTLKFNNTSDQMRFRYYGSGQQAIQLYKLS